MCEYVRVRVFAYVYVWLRQCVLTGARIALACTHGSDAREVERGQAGGGEKEVSADLQKHTTPSARVKGYAPSKSP